MSNQNQNQNANQNATQKSSTQQQEQLEPQYTDEELAKYNEVMDSINNAGNAQFMKLPSETGTMVVQFFRDKRKLELVNREFIDKQTGKPRLVKRIKYKVLDPEHRDEGEKDLELPRTLAEKVERIKSKGHYLIELSRKGAGLKTTYDAVSVD